MSNLWSHIPTLEGEFVQLRPLLDSDAAALLACTAPDTFTYFVTKPPPTWDIPGFAAFINTLSGTPTTRPMAVIDRSTNRLVGCTCYLDVDQANRSVEIGCTFYHPAVRGTHINPQAKLLLLSHAFETLHCVRVLLKTDARNLHSQRAIAKLGARYEGTLRQHRILPDGFIRDTACFSILPDEWPEVKAGLLQRLARSATPNPSPAITIRPAIAADTESILPMVQQICAMHSALDPTKYAFLPDIIDRYRRWLPVRAADPRSVLLVAHDALGLVGFLVGSVEPEIPIYHISEYGFIHDLWIEPRARRMGVGTALARQALADFKTIGVSQVRLDTANANQSARRLFAGCGFRPSATEMIAALEPQYP
jgi:RimJ/RimL family protein N-acetyltransferase